MEAPHTEEAQLHLWSLYLSMALGLLAHKQSSQRPGRLVFAGPGSDCVGYA